VNACRCVAWCIHSSYSNAGRLCCHHVVCSNCEHGQTVSRAGAVLVGIGKCAQALWGGCTYSAEAPRHTM
jgi:hypothetical protein